MIIIVLIYSGKMRFRQVRRQVILKLTRKEVVIGESRTLDTTILYKPKDEHYFKTYYWNLLLERVT